MVEAELEIIENQLKPLGLFRQRAIRLKNLAVEMVRRNGRLPKDRAELESIPFLGQYISNAIELLIQQKASPLIDVNMARLLERCFGEREMADIRFDPYLQRLSYKIVNHSRAKEINWAILDFAASLCKSQKPKCSNCPIAMKCNKFKYQSKKY